MKVATYKPEFVRPDLPVPLSPLRGLPKVVRRRLLGPRGPGFARAHRATVAWAAATGAVALASLLLPPWRGPAVACSALLGLYLLARTFALVAFERRQRAFEPRWLAAQSEVLRSHAFEVLRFRVQGSYGEPDARRTYDLTRPDDVRDLLHRQDRERASGALSRATVEFAYWAGGGDTLAVAEVTRGLSELTFLQGRAAPARAWIRFPEARYLSRPGTGERPAQRTYWALSGPVVVSVSESDSGGAAGPAEVSGLGSAR